MAGLSTFVGGMAAGAQGFEDGTREAKRDQMRDVSDDLTRRQTEAAVELLPAQTQYAKDRIASASGDLVDKETLRKPMMDLSLAKTAFEVQDTIHKTALEAMKNPSEQNAVRDTVLGQIGAVAAAGDPVMLGAALEQAARTPIMPPEMNNLPKIKTAELVPAAPGMLDIGGNPITKGAIKINHVDGTVTYLNAASMEAPYARYKQALAKSNEVVVKPNTEIVRRNPDGSMTPIYAGPETSKYARDENGNLLNPELAGTGGRGAGTGSKAGGKAPKEEIDATLENIFKDLETKPTLEQKSAITAMAGKVLESGALTGTAQAVQAAVDITMHPEKVQPSLNIRTGTFDGYYTDKTITGGRNIMVTPQMATFDELIAAKKDPKAIAAQVNGVLAKLPNKEQQEGFIAAAYDPELKKALVEKSGANGPAMSRLLDLYAKVNPRKGGAPSPSSSGPSITERLGRGIGLGQRTETPAAADDYKSEKDWLRKRATNAIGVMTDSALEKVLNDTNANTRMRTAAKQLLAEKNKPLPETDTSYLGYTVQ